MKKYSYSNQKDYKSTSWSSGLYVAGYYGGSYYASAISTDKLTKGVYNFTLKFFTNIWVSGNPAKMGWVLSNSQPIINSSSSPSPKDMINSAITSGEFSDCSWGEKTLTISNVTLKNDGVYTILFYSLGTSYGETNFVSGKDVSLTTTYIKSIEKVTDTISGAASVVTGTNNRQYLLTPKSSIGSKNISSYTFENSTEDIVTIEYYNKTDSDALKDTISDLTDKKNALSTELKTVNVITDNGDTSNLYSLLTTKYNNLIASKKEELNNYKQNTFLITFNKYGTANFTISSILADQDSDEYSSGSKTYSNLTLKALTFTKSLKNSLLSALKVYYPVQTSTVYTGSTINTLIPKNYDDTIFNDFVIQWKLSTQTDYSAKIPTVSNAGTYKIQFKITGTFYEDSYEGTLYTLKITKKDTSFSKFYTILNKDSSIYEYYSNGNIPLRDTSTYTYCAVVNNKDKSVIQGVLNSAKSTVTYTWGGDDFYNSLTATYPTHTYYSISNIISDIKTNLGLASEDYESDNNTLKIYIPLSVITTKSITINGKITTNTDCYYKDTITDYDIIVGSDGTTKKLYFKDYLGKEHLYTFKNDYCTIKDEYGNIKIYNLLSDGTIVANDKATNIIYYLKVEQGGTLTINQITDLSKINAATFKTAYTAEFRYGTSQTAGMASDINILNIIAYIVPSIEYKDLLNNSDINKSFLIPFYKDDNNKYQLLAIKLPGLNKINYQFQLIPTAITTGQYFKYTLYSDITNKIKAFTCKISNDSGTFSYYIPIDKKYRFDIEGPFLEDSSDYENTIILRGVCNEKTNQITFWIDKNTSWSYDDDTHLSRELDGTKSGQYTIIWNTNGYSGSLHFSDTKSYSVLKGTLFSKNKKLIDINGIKYQYDSSSIFTFNNSQYKIVKTVEKDDGEQIVYCLIQSAYKDTITNSGKSYAISSTPLKVTIVKNSDTGLYNYDYNYT